MSMIINYDMKLSKYQKSALGISKQQKTKQIQQLLSIASAFKSIDKANLEMGDDGQTYGQFVDMKGIQPNQEGTGRVAFEDITIIQYFFLHKNKKPKNIPDITQKRIGQFFRLYLNIQTQLIQLPLKLTKSFTIHDIAQNIQYSPQINSNITLSKQKKTRINVLQLLDMLTQYKKSSDSILICFIDAELYEPSQESDNVQSVYGRACGDGVAAITLMINNKQEQQTMIETAVHEVLHTLGFDHCLAWSCLMNPLINGQLWLCPCCIRKILSQNKKNLQQWISSIVEISKDSDFKCVKQGINILKKIPKK